MDYRGRSDHCGPAQSSPAGGRRRAGDNGPVTESSLLQAAVDELYAQPLAEFTTRRKALAAAAKKAGDRVAATAIAELRKPTLSADTVNRLVRAAPDEVQELLQLGIDLRTAEKALDAAGMRALGDRRRRLVNDLAELAFEVTGQSNPSPAVREEVTGTLNAALADEQVAERLVSGALVTRASWDGFGSAQLPELAADLPPRAARPAAPRAEHSAPDQQNPEPATAQDDAAERGTVARPTAPGPEVDPTNADRTKTGRTKNDRTKADRAKTDKTNTDKTKTDKKKADRTEPDRTTVDRTTADLTTADQAKADRADAERARAEQAKADAEAKRVESERAEQRQRVEAADKEAKEAAQAAARAQEVVRTIDRQISELNLQLAHQRQQLAEAQRALRAAETRRRTAQLAATRAGAAGR